MNSIRRLTYKKRIKTATSMEEYKSKYAALLIKEINKAKAELLKRKNEVISIIVKLTFKGNFIKFR